MKKDKKTIKMNTERNLSTVIVILIFALLGIANIIGIIYLYGVYGAITTTGTTGGTPNQTLLVQPLNTTLYSSIAKDRQQRRLYTPSSTVPSSNVNEIFGTGN